MSKAKRDNFSQLLEVCRKNFTAIFLAVASVVVSCVIGYYLSQSIFTAEKGLTAFHAAVQKSDLDGLRELLISNASFLDFPSTTHSLTPLHLAVRTKSVDTDIIKTNLDAGASASTTDNEGHDVLVDAVKAGNPAVVAMLLAHGADTSQPAALSAACFDASTMNTEIVAALAAKIDQNLALDGERGDCLERAATLGYSAVIAVLLAAPLKPSAKSLASALSSSVGPGSLEDVKTLIAAGADAKAYDSSALRSAASGGNLEITQVLLAAGADAKADDSSALLAAVQSGSADICEALLAAGASPDSKRGAALVAAASLSTPQGEEVLRKLIQAGANLNLGKSTDGESAFLIKYKQATPLDLIELMLSKGANVGERDGAGKSAMSIALASRKMGMIELLLRYKADADDGVKGETTLFNLIKASTPKSDHALINLLLAHDASPNAANTYGYSCLIDASVKGDLPLLQALIEKGADLNHMSGSVMYSYTALTAAAYHKHEDVMDALLAAGANVDSVDNKGQSAMFFAVSASNAPLIKKLIAHNANVNLMATADGQEFNLLLDAASTRHGFFSSEPSIFKLLANAGAKPTSYLLWRAAGSRTGGDKCTAILELGGVDVNYRESAHGGSTPILAAAGAGCQDCITALIAKGGDVNALDNQDQTALMYAVSNDDKEMVTFLLTHGARQTINNVNKQRATALSGAKSDEMRTLLRSYYAR